MTYGVMDIIERVRLYQKKAKSIGATSFPDWTDELAQALLDANHKCTRLQKR